MTLTEIAELFLRTHAAGEEVEGGWLHAEALLEARLDCTPESLERLDALLAQIRDHAKPTEADLLSVRGHNFQWLVVFYLFEIARRRTGADLVWHDRESALRVLPPGTQLPVTPFTRLLVNAFDQGAIFLPLGWLGAQLLATDRIMTSAEYLDDVVAELERDGPPIWWQAVHAMGRIASWQMMMAADGGTVRPMMLGERAPTTWIVLTDGPAPGEGGDDSPTAGSRELEENAEGHAWQVLSHGGSCDAGGARLDAVIVVGETYGPRPLKMTLAFPYRPASAERPLAILPPLLRGANVPDETIARFGGALERGIQSVKWVSGTTWDELRETAGEASPSSPASSAGPVATEGLAPRKKSRWKLW